jgi:hypothetical protein
MEELRDKQLHHSHYWVMRFANKTRSHRKDLNDISTATSQHPTIEVLLETVFSTVACAQWL